MTDIRAANFKHYKTLAMLIPPVMHNILPCRHSSPQPLEILLHSHMNGHILYRILFKNCPDKIQMKLFSIKYMIYITADAKAKPNYTNHSIHVLFLLCFFALFKLFFIHSLLAGTISSRSCLRHTQSSADH